MVDQKQGMRAIWLMLIAAFVATLNETTMGVALTDLMHHFDVSATEAQWLSTSFMLTMAVIIPVTGFLMQRFTTRTLFLSAMTLFSLGTLIALFSFDFPMLIVARVVQASGTAVLSPLVMTTIMNVVPPERRGRMMGIISLVLALAPAIGPTLAGILLDSFGWQAIFATMLPFALIALWLGWRFIPNLGETSAASVDVWSMVLAALGFGGLVYGISEIGTTGNGSAHGQHYEDTDRSLVVVLIALGVGLVSLILFLWRQRVLQRTNSALLDLRVFRTRTFSLSILLFGLLSIPFFGALTIVPIYLQEGLGVSPLTTGLLMLPGALLVGLAGPIVGAAYDKFGARALLIPGTIIASAGLWIFATFNHTTPEWLVAVAQLILSLGLALSFTPLFTASLASLPQHLYSYGSAVVGTMQQVTGAIGVALLVSIMTGVKVAASDGGSSAEVAHSDGAQVAFFVAALLSLVAIVVAFFLKVPKPSTAPQAPENSAPPRSAAKEH